jgi:hypothetical protein
MLFQISRCSRHWPSSPLSQTTRSLAFAYREAWHRSHAASLGVTAQYTGRGVTQTVLRRAIAAGGPWRSLSLERSCRQRTPAPTNNFCRCAASGDPDPDHVDRAWHQDHQQVDREPVRDALSRLAPRPEGIFVNPYERGEIGPDLFRAAVGPLLPLVPGSLRRVGEHCLQFRQLFLWAVMPESLEVILWCAVLATWLMLRFAFLSDGYKIAFAEHP